MVSAVAAGKKHGREREPIARARSNEGERAEYEMQPRIVPCWQICQFSATKAATRADTRFCNELMLRAGEHAKRYENKCRT